MALLETQQINVRFGGHHAVRDVDLDVAAGTVTGLIGPNGAGKTTTFNVITGLQDATAGKVLFEDEDISSLKPHERARKGIARTFQRLEVFGSLSARDNILTAAEIRRSWSGDKTDVNQIVDGIIERVGIGHVADERVDAMPTGLARLVELGRALATQPKLLLLDEPASGLDDSESDAFARLLLELAGEGLGVLIVEHDVQLVMKVCAHIHVLDYGAIIAVGPPEEIQSNNAVLEAYLGASA
ncbi:MAG TPA: ABC transporter ATP-binding protein [Acidimicrobiales bacterium]